ncbi:MAG TPA: 23S rRNA (guanosine(2251)-2'-O)-methyltransferase RlmB [Anaerolineaceae bacterium]|jgi:23S rRNA (guanosine2251-2'-O)-methyltransferase|nr:23S rRNA (guanosine(2251)-2'-O)-methyltransferase RlmB [Chloroflexota bacterium]HNS06359.1 23S rRNA (guanosine(2251)-2'-O)-methyltransferase RlmB [Anaerolineaceae bacterium]
MKEWITGRNPVMEVMQAKRRQVFRLLLASGVEEKGRIAEILRAAALIKVPVERVARERLERLGENPQGVAVEVGVYPYVELYDIYDLAKERNEALFVLVLDVIQNPQNLGTLLRTAEAVGVHGVINPQHRAAEVTPAVVSASAGASEHLLITRGNIARSLEQLKEAGAWVVGLAEGEDSSAEVPLGGPIALVVGNEGEGMRALVRQQCDYILSLPMRGRIQSLNAAVAGSIVLYQVLLARQKTSR